MAEFLACGVPVIGNRGVGDMDGIIEKYDIGVVVENDSSESFLIAFLSPLFWINKTLSGDKN